MNDDDNEVVGNITQEVLVGYLLGNYDVWVLAAPILKLEYFDKQYRSIVKYVLEHTEKYSQIPSIEIIKMKTGVSIEIPEDAMDERTAKWVLEEIENFCRDQALRIEILNAAEILGKDRAKNISAEMVNKFKLINEISINEDLGIEIHADSEEILNRKEELIQISTGYKHIDFLTGGGLPCPGLFIVAGQSGFGKSVVLSNLAINFAERGMDVIYITLELSQDRMAKRMQGMMTNIPIRDVRSNKEEVVNIMNDRMKCGEGSIFIKKMKMNGTTIADIRAYHRKIVIRTGKRPRVLCLDYMDLMDPLRRGVDVNNIHLRDKFISQEIYDFIEEKGVNMLCCTASQMLKGVEDRKAEERGQGQIAGGSPKVNNSDYAGMLNRDFINDMLDITFVKARDGGHQGRVPLNWNNDTLRITNAEDEQFYEMNPRLNPALKHKTTKKVGVNKNVNSTPMQRINKKLSDAIMSDDGEMR